MRGWTIQHADWWRAANGSRLRANWRDVEPDDKCAYRAFTGWLQSRGLWKTRTAPIWLWTAYSNHTRKPDLRCGGHLSSGTPGVRVELRYPPGIAVYMCFQRWCSFMSEFSAGEIKPARLDTLIQSLLINESSVYSTRRRNDPWALDGVLQVQAILPYIERSWIKDVKPFTAR